MLQHYQINVIAPTTIINELLTDTSNENYQLVGVNITSGAAERAISGWSAYCSSKASINMYTKTVAIEQDEKNTGHKIIAFSPGIMDTAMQERIRKSSEDSFIDVDRFRQYKENNHLKETDLVGGILVDLLTDESTIENGKIYDVNDYF